MQQMQFTLNDLLLQLQTSAQGNLSPSLISPTELISVLTQIQAQLPSNIILPYTPDDEGMLDYYKYLQPSMIATKSGFHVLMAIPLMDKETEYEIYRAVQVPVPNSDLMLGAQYSLESDYFAISRAKTDFVPLSLNEIFHCLDGPICQFSYPPFSVINYPQCIIALFLHDDERTNDVCKKNLIPMSDTPVIKQLFSHKYVISTPISFDMIIACPDGDRSVKIHDIHVFTVDEGCSMTSKYFQLPTQVKGETFVERDVQFSAQMEISKLSVNIWNQTNMANYLFSDSEFDLSKLQQELPKLDKIPIEQMQYILAKTYEQNRRTDDYVQPQEMPVWKERSISIGSTSIILIIALFVLFIFRKRIFRKKPRDLQVVCNKHPRTPLLVKFHKDNKPLNDPSDPENDPEIEHVTIVPDTART